MGYTGDTSEIIATLLLWTPVLRHLINWLGVRMVGTDSINAVINDDFKVTKIHETFKKYGTIICRYSSAFKSSMSGVVATLQLRTPGNRHFIKCLGVGNAGTDSIDTMFNDGFKVLRGHKTVGFSKGWHDHLSLQ